jgi:hypothetical protein
MKFILFVEGHTERDVLPPFFKRYLDPLLPRPIGILPVNFNGAANLWRDVAQKAKFYLQGPALDDEIVAVISLLDIYGLDTSPNAFADLETRLRWAKEKVEGAVSDSRFRQYFAVHELEAWLLSDPNIFPKEVRADITNLSHHPESVNMISPPKRRLDQIFDHRLRRGYNPRVDGAKFFRSLDPEKAREKCPYFKRMLDEILDLARNH